MQTNVLMFLISTIQVKNSYSSTELLVCSEAYIVQDHSNGEVEPATFSTKPIDFLFYCVGANATLMAALIALCDFLFELAARRNWPQLRPAKLNVDLKWQLRRSDLCLPENKENFM